jgi:hypothetical protein
MSISAMSGPLIVFGQSPFPALEYNPDLGSSLFYAGAGILDPRQPFTYLPGEAESQPDVGWLGFDNITTQSIVPYTKSTTALVVSSATSGSNNALTLVNASSASTGVYITTTFTRSDTGALDAGVAGAGLVALDAYTSVTATISNGIMTVSANSAMPITPGMVITSVSSTVTLGSIAGVYVTQQLNTGTTGSSTTGQGVIGQYSLSTSQLSTQTSGTVTLALPNVLSCTVPYGFSAGVANSSIPLWNPQALIGRAVTIVTPASITASAATISGYDIYGYPMVETIGSLTASGSFTGRKAFRYIKSITLNVADANPYTAGTSDVFGLPLRSDNFGDITVNYASSMTAVTAIAAATSYVASDRTSPALATTGDVRGTYGAFTSATGANKLVIRQSPQAYNIGYNAGLFGNTQYSNF